MYAPLVFLLTALLAPALVLGDSLDKLSGIEVLRRLTYGPAPGDAHNIKNIGASTYIRQQLSPEDIDESPDLERYLSGLKLVNQSPAALYKQFNLVGASGGLVERVEIRKRRAAMFNELRQARLARAISSRRQLQEVMTEFWMNHFNVYINKSDVGVWVPNYENTIRQMSLGKFPEILLRTARHPAMLRYLDNAQSKATGTKRGKKEFGLNENYARELMELHTLGVNGGYTQSDVTALARILTGWTINYRAIAAGSDHELFLFDKSAHDKGSKRLLGIDFSPEGENEGIKAIEMLAMHASTAKHISGKLAAYFVSDSPPSTLVHKMSDEFMKSGGDIRAVLLVLFESPEFAGSLGRQELFKTPYQYAVGVARASSLAPENTRQLQIFLRKSGMQIYEWRTPDGPSNRKSMWLQPDGLLRRVELSQRIVAIAPGDNDEKNARINTVLTPFLSGKTKERIAGGPAGLRAVMSLSAPDMMWR